MFPIAGQTAGPIGLNFFVDTHGWPGEKNFSRATPGPSASVSYMYILYNENLRF